MPPINEKGRTYNKKNESLLRQAYTAIKAALASLNDDSEEDDDLTKAANDNKKVKEAKGWSMGDLHAALAREIREQEENAYIQDIFDDHIVYQKGWSGSYFKRDYTLDETGVATFGDPTEVSRKVSYVPTSDANAGNKVNPPVEITTEAQTIELDGDTIALVEKAVNPSGEVLLKLISPGWGSSGYYSKEVLQKAAADRIFHKGLHNFIDHPTAQEESARPEGSLTKLGSVLVEDAIWLDDHNGNGPGLYAKGKVVPQFSETLNVIADDIGMSIRANGKAKVGEVDGKRGNVIEAITEGRSVDYVTLPGRGGKVLQLAESKRNSASMENEPMTNEEKLEMQRLREAVASLAEQNRRNEARSLVNAALAQFPQLHSTTRTRLLESLSNNIPLTETQAIDTPKLLEAVKTAVTAEMQYLAQLGVGSIQGLGTVGMSGETDTAKLLEAIEANTKDLNAISLA